MTVEATESEPELVPSDRYVRTEIWAGAREHRTDVRLAVLEPETRPGSSWRLVSSDVTAFHEDQGVVLYGWLWERECRPSVLLSRETTGGDVPIYWRGSVSDFVTDLQATLDAPTLTALASEIALALRRIGRAAPGGR